MDRNPIYSDATELAALVRSRQVSPVELVQTHLDRIETVNPRLNAIVTVAERALVSARAAEAAVLAGEPLGPLHGVPFTVKDSIDTAGVPTQRGSPIFRNRMPDADATSVARLKAAGAILLAKTNLPEFSLSTETDNGLTGRTNNPWNFERTPGGSSGGESAAIAAGMSPLGLGTDVAISIRGPAANTGIVGFKATHGRVPMTGIWPREPRRFWHVGPMARSVRDVALAYSLLAGPDHQDGFSTLPAAIDFGVGPEPGRPMRVGWLVAHGFGPIDPDVAATVKAAAGALADTGCHVEPVRIPALEHENAFDIYKKLSVMELKPVFAEATFGREHEMFGISRAMLAAPEPSISDFVRAEQAAERLRDGFADYFQRYDVLLCPVVPVPAHPHHATKFVIDGKTVAAVPHTLAATLPLNVTGLPGLSIRFGTSRDGLPIAVQLVSRWNAESTILHLGAVLEAVREIPVLHPNL